MRMQTGPAPGQEMRSWLVWTGVGELLNVPLFTVIAWFFLRERPGPWTLTAIGLATLNLILLEGGLYWIAKWWRGGRQWPIGFLYTLYALTGLALLVFPFMLLGGFGWGLATPRPTDLILGAALYAFALGEFIHYFLVKINMRPREWRAGWQQRQPQPARFRRELRRALSAARLSKSRRVHTS
jgi:hypothetical protein